MDGSGPKRDDLDGAALGDQLAIEPRQALERVVPTVTLLGAAGVTFIMGVPGADDIMLNYQSTSFHDALYLRRTLGLRHAPEFEAWLQKMALIDLGGVLLSTSVGHPLLESLSPLGRKLPEAA